MGGDTSGAPTGGNSWDSFTTKFNSHDLNGLKDMLDGANVQQVRDVAQHWQDLHDLLVGPGDGGDGIQKRFDDAVKKVLESWHGDTAEKFSKRAQEISQNFTAGAPYASHTAQVMGLTAQDLQKAIDKVKPIDDGWNWGDDVWGDMPWSDQIDDKDLNKVLQEGASTQGVLDANKDNLSGHQKKRLEAAVAMENLGTAYVVRASSLKPPTVPRGGIDDKIPDHNDQSNGLGTMPMPFPGMGGPGGGGPGGGGGGGGGMKIPTRGMKPTPTPTPEMPKTPNMPNEPGVNGGMGSMKPKIPDVHTGLDGLQGGGGAGGPGVKVPGPGLGGGGGGAGVHMPSGGGGGGLTGVPGIPGGGMPGRGGTPGVKTGPGGAGGVKSGPGGAGAGARTGRTGMPGMGGAHGAGAGKGAGVKGGGAGGAQARQKGGIVGSSGGKSGGGAQGGSGLHRSRGGSAAGKNAGAAGRRPAGMMGGAHGAHGGKGEGKGQDGSRPDYLVEDEETWTPERNVAPRVIE